MIGLLRAVIGDAVRGMRYGRGTLVFAFAILTIALTATTVTIAIVDGVAIRSLPYAAPHELVGISSPGLKPGTVSPVTPQEYFAFAEGARAFSAIGASRASAPLKLSTGGGTESLVTRRVTSSLFDTLGVRAAAGRLFSDQDARPGAANVAILSHDLWVRRFGADPDAIGRVVKFDQGSIQILGVLPDGVWHPMELAPPDIYLPYVGDEAERSNGRARAMAMVGRLRRGVSIDQARADITRLASSPMVVQPLQDQVVGSARGWLMLLLAAVALVLLTASVNVSTLLLARTTTRVPEFAIRASLGQARSILLAGVLLEGLVLAFAAGAAAVVASFWGVEIATASLPVGLLTRASTIAIDSRVMAISFGVAALCSMLFATAPAWLAARSNLSIQMKASGGPLISSRLVDRSLSVFLTGEVAVVSVLLVATTLVVQSFIAIVTTDLGFDRTNLVSISYERPRDSSAVQDSQLIRQELLTAARSVPGVVNAAVSANATLPLSGGSVRYSLVIPGFGEALQENMLETRMVTPGYFGVMGMQLVDGRLLADADRAGAPLVMLINEVAAHRFFPGRNPVGQIVTFRGPTTIVGVLRSVRLNGPESDAVPEMYLPADQEPARGRFDTGTLVVRVEGAPAKVASDVRLAMRRILGVEPDEPRFVDNMFRRITAGRRFNTLVIAGFGLIAIALAVGGVYGTIAFTVAGRYREIGLRLALGATRSRILSSVLGRTMRMVSMGGAAGLFTAWAGSNALRGFVFGVRATEPMAYATVAGLIVLIGMLAALLPAIRAARLDPTSALRHD